MADDRLAAAKKYALLGWSVVPLHWITKSGFCSCGNKNCRSPGKHPRIKHGLKDAATDENLIETWFKQSPFANIGIVTGETSGLFVLDIDPKNGGLESLERLIEQHGPIPDDVMQITGSGGRHYVFKYPGDIGRSTTNLWPGIDTRGTGGYIVVAPSNHISGDEYFWDAEADPLEGAKPSDCPQWLLDKLAEKSSVAAVPEVKAAAIEKAEVRRIKAALSYIPADDRDIWLKVGMALHSTQADDQAFGLWCEWAQQSEKFDMADSRRVWASFKPNGVALGSLFAAAKARGWTPPDNRPPGPPVEVYADDLKTNPVDYEVSVDNQNKETPLDMEVFSLTGMSKELRKKMLTDRHVLKNIAILGQATVIYAKPNTGKTLLTLRLLCDSIKAGEIDGSDVMFINADDTYQGLITKIEIAEEVGFNVLAPGYQDFEANRLIEYMSRMVLEETARGKVLVLDTIKKFVSLMDKKESSLFMHAGRQFVVKGGTLIMLAHTNKNRDADGKLVYSGTSDLVDDADCAFILDEVDGHNDYKHVLFENIKARGCVARELAFRYLNTDDRDYLEVLNSVSVLNDDDTKKIKAEKAINNSLQENGDVINAIIETIKAGIVVRTELVKVVNKEFGFPVRKVRKTLEAHDGTNYQNGGRWISTNIGANKFSYEITPETGKCL